MSFLNPVNEPVKRFSSTDADAPQINYNSRVAGDVKAVLKACLVTGYGATDSAGWSVVNEVDNVCEFVSPSAAMSDYRLGVDDNTATKTDWYYQYQNIKNTIPNAQGAAQKNFSQMDKSSPQNGWQLIVSDRGLFLVEILHNTLVNNTMARVTHWGLVKSALNDSTGQCIGFWQAGVASPAVFTQYFYANKQDKFYNIAGITDVEFGAANLKALSNPNDSYGASNVDMTARLYMYSGAQLLGQQVGLYVTTVANVSDLYGVYDTTLDARHVVKICIGRNEKRAGYLQQYCSVMQIPLDYWEY